MSEPCPTCLLPPGDRKPPQTTYRRGKNATCPRCGIHVTTEVFNDKNYKCRAAWFRAQLRRANEY